LALSASLVLFGLPALAADNGCSTGGSALADAYVVADPIYATFFGDETGAFVARNRQHFLAQGDSVRCARALANAFAQKAAQVYDPELQAIRNQKRRELEGQADRVRSTRCLGRICLDQLRTCPPRRRSSASSRRRL
jgi:hypothetical protein